MLFYLIYQCYKVCNISHLSNSYSYFDFKFKCISPFCLTMRPLEVKFYYLKMIQLYKHTWHWLLKPFIAYIQPIFVKWDATN